MPPPPAAALRPHPLPGGFWRLLLAAGVVSALLLLMPPDAGAAEVAAEVNPPQARPNQQISLTISVTDGNPDAVPELRLPLQVQQVSGVSTGQQFQMTNGVASSKITFTWAIVGVEPGDFVIPAQEVSVNGTVMQTREVQLKILQGQTPSAPRGDTARGPDDAFLQLEVGKTEIYLGELVPLSASLYIPRQMGLRRFGLIDIDKDDFAIQRFPQQAEQTNTVAAGVGYNVFTFRTTLSALREGDLRIGPASQELLVEIMTADSFGRPNFNFPFAEPQKLVATSGTIPVKVLPLPEEGKPADFSGAVGSFTLTATASPTTGLKVGDPISVELTLSGSGNFDAVAEPKLVDEAGWKTYPGRRFNAEGQVDPVLMPTVERTVNYASVIVPTQAHSTVPSFRITYFDPERKQYVELETPPIPLSIEAAPAPLPGETAAGTDAEGETEPPVAAPVPQLADILTNLPAAATWREPKGVNSWREPAVLAAAAAPFALLLLAWGAKLAADRRERLRTGAAGRVREAWDAARAGGLADDEFLRRASQFLLVATGAAPGSAGPDSAAVLKRYAEHNFAAPGAPAAPLSSGERRDILRQLGKVRQDALAAVEGEGAGLANPRAGAAAAVLLLWPALAVLGQEVEPPATQTESAAPAAVETPADTPAPAARSARDPDETYRKALAAFQEGKLREAQYLAESLVKNPEEVALSGELFQLIGHTRFRAADPGRAALWYQRAELLDPRSPELRQNLRLLDERQRFLRFQPPNPLVSWSLQLSERNWMLLGLGGLWLVMLPLAWRVWSGRFGAVPRAALVAGLLALAPSALMLSLRPRPESRVEGVSIVTARDVRAHSAATSTAGPVIDLPPGSAVRLLEDRGAWVYCEIPWQVEPLRGWVETSALTPLWPYDPAAIP
jgi:hypothetical protein